MQLPKLRSWRNEDAEERKDSVFDPLYKPRVLGAHGLLRRAALSGLG